MDASYFNNCSYQQYHTPGEFCSVCYDLYYGNRISSGWGEPAILQGMALRPDGYFGRYYSGSVTRPNSTFSLTDMQAAAGLIYFQDSLNWNATTVHYPGPFTYVYAGVPDPTNPGGYYGPAMQFIPINSVMAPFVYLGTTTGAMGPCPFSSPINYNGGFLWSCRFAGGSDTTSMIMDACYDTGRGRTCGIFSDVIRLYNTSSAGGFTGSYTRYYGLPTAFGAGGCQTYSELYDEVLNATIYGNPPSQGTPISTPDDPVKNDPGIGGIRNSIWKKVYNSEAAYNRGQYNAAGNTLDACVHHCEAQSGKHLDADSAQDIINCIKSLKNALGF
jgi:hypothetical protein